MYPEILNKIIRFVHFDMKAIMMISLCFQDYINFHATDYV